MKRPKLMLFAFALTAVVLTAWAGDDAAASVQQSDKDKNVVAPAQPANEAGKQEHQAPKSGDRNEQAPQSKPREDRAPQSRDRAEQAPQSRDKGEQAPRSVYRDYGTPQPQPDAVQTPSVYRRSGSRTVSEPAQVSEPNAPGAAVRPPSGGRGGQGGGRGGYGPGPGGPGRRDPGHGWYSHHNDWRHRNYRHHGSWRFLFHFGPRIYFAPIHYPHIVRLPRSRVGVYVRQTGDDYVGVQFADAVREQLRERGMRVVYSQDDARLELYLVSMDQDPEEPGYGSAISVSYIWYPGHRFITAQMVDAGIDQIDALAQSVVEYADDLVDDYR